ncbi:MAG: hypothetical protein Q9214_003276 [Letrouitia sp. 1 TL-2023]
MFYHGVLPFLAPAILLAGAATAEGLYSKKSAVLQVDGKSYDKLIANSNMVSIVEFYAPWCGHCKNLKPAYEKAAKSLDGLAQVAAVNCDDDGNKPFCGTMGVQGFPTLKIVKPSKKPGKPTVEDYQGARSTKDIVDAVKQAIPNNVKRIGDKSLNSFLDTKNETAKAILFSDKGTTSALTKVLAAEYRDAISFAQIRNKEKAAVEMFGVTEFPTLIVLPGGTEPPVRFDGSFSKSAMQDFLAQFASTQSKTAPKPKKQKPLAEEPAAAAEPVPAEETAKSEEVASSFSSASSAHASAEASTAAGGATTETLEDESQPTESPDPQASPEDAPKPAPVPDVPPPIAALIEQTILEQKCLGPKTTTCILALLPPAAASDEEAGSVLLPDDATAALASLAEIAEKHSERGSKLFPFYSVPSRNTGSAVVREALKLDKDMELVAVNSRRGWFRRFEGERYGVHEVETWVDAIRLGEGQKGKLPDSLIVAEEEKKNAETHEEL